MRRWMGIVCCALALMCIGNSLKIYAKAYLARWLIADAWRAQLEDQRLHKPWPWADTWPVAKLVFRKQNRHFYVLDGGHGSALAFGPGLVRDGQGLARPGQKGTLMIGGHRDTHFSLLEDAEIGEELALQDHLGRWQTYRISHTEVIDTEKQEWRIDPTAEELHLVTCYPFEKAYAGGPLRFVAIAQPVSL